jgi:hypothetical protein
MPPARGNSRGGVSYRRDGGRVGSSPLKEAPGDVRAEL